MQDIHEKTRKLWKNLLFVNLNLFVYWCMSIDVWKNSKIVYWCYLQIWKNLVLLFANYENYEFVTVFVCYCVICKYEKTFSYLEFIDVWVYQLMLFWCGFSSKVLMFNHFEGIILIQWPVLLLLVFYVGNGDDMWFQFHEMYNVMLVISVKWMIIT